MSNMTRMHQVEDTMALNNRLAIGFQALHNALELVYRFDLIVNVTLHISSSIPMNAKAAS